MLNIPCNSSIAFAYMIYMSLKFETTCWCYIKIIIVLDCLRIKQHHIFNFVSSVDRSISYTYNIPTFNHYTWFQSHCQITTHYSLHTITYAQTQSLNVPGTLRSLCQPGVSVFQRRFYFHETILLLKISLLFGCGLYFILQYQFFSLFR